MLSDPLAPAITLERRRRHSRCCSSSASTVSRRFRGPRSYVEARPKSCQRVDAGRVGPGSTPRRVRGQLRAHLVDVDAHLLEDVSRRLFLTQALLEGPDGRLEAVYSGSNPCDPRIGASVGPSVVHRLSRDRIGS
ncbi:hypothetical protein D8S78_02845 [Natrialba swarupiae]|nr:hypothetical protein [Natrialba swarupiae]